MNFPLFSDSKNLLFSSKQSCEIWILNKDLHFHSLNYLLNLLHLSCIKLWIINSTDNGAKNLYQWNVYCRIILLCLRVLHFYTKLKGHWAKERLHLARKLILKGCFYSHSAVELVEQRVVKQREKSIWLIVFTCDIFFIL